MFWETMLTFIIDYYIVLYSITYPHDLEVLTPEHFLILCYKWNSGAQNWCRILFSYQNLFSLPQILSFVNSSLLGIAWSFIPHIDNAMKCTRRSETRISTTYNLSDCTFTISTNRSVTPQEKAMWGRWR